MNDILGMRGELIVSLKDIDGTTTNHYYNNIMFNAKVMLARFLVGQEPGSIVEMAVGTDDEEVDSLQTELFSEIFRKDLNSKITEGNMAIMDCVYGQGEAIGNLREAGLFTSDGIMFARANIEESKGIMQELTISWRITIN